MRITIVIANDSVQQHSVEKENYFILYFIGETVMGPGKLLGFLGYSQGVY